MNDEITVIPDEAKRLFRALLAARDKHDEAKTAEKRAKDEVDRLTIEVHEALVDSIGMSTLPVDLGPPYGRVKLLPTATVYANVINEEKLQNYLENSAQVEEYTRPDLAKGRLNELARQLLEDGQDFPPGLDRYVKRSVRVTRQKG